MSIEIQIIQKCTDYTPCCQIGIKIEKEAFSNIQYAKSTAIFTFLKTELITSFIIRENAPINSNLKSLIIKRI